jgi:hypothetical protein
VTVDLWLRSESKRTPVCLADRHLLLWTFQLPWPSAKLQIRKKFIIFALPGCFLGSLLVWLWVILEFSAVVPGRLLGTFITVSVLAFIVLQSCRLSRKAYLSKHTTTTVHPIGIDSSGSDRSSSIRNHASRITHVKRHSTHN